MGIVSDILLQLADEIDGQASISARPGQLADLERIAARLRAEHRRIHSWAGLMSLLDEHYPSDIFVGSYGGDLGPRMVTLIRECDALRLQIRRLEQAQS